MTRTRFFLVALLALVAGLVAIFLTPFAVSNGIRLWAWRQGEAQGLRVAIDKINAPLLRPVVISGLRITSTGDDASRIDLSATRAKIDLNLSHILLHRRGHPIRHLSIEDLHGEIRRRNPGARQMTKGGWSALQKLLPQTLSLAASEMRVQQGPTVILVRNCVLSASDIEAGRITLGEFMIASPWMRQTFSQLRGATRWENDRLTLAGLTLTRGLDLQSVTADLSRLGSQHVGLEFDADTFGGKIRGNISHEWRSRQAGWKIVGAASDISLAQTSEAIGLTDHVDGLVRACNFTFRGNLADPVRVTASLWTEMIDFTWRNRTAEAIMLGVALYNEQIQVQQLYIKQKTNQFTLNGQASLPSKSSDWLSSNFRGDISATINNLGDFVSLFGADSGEFTGKLTIQGALNTRARQLGGRLTIAGTSLTIFKTAMDELNANLKFEGTKLAIEQFTLKRKNDFFNAEGTIDLSHGHMYSGTLNATVSDFSDYMSILRRRSETISKPMPVSIQATIDASKWDAHATITLPDSSTLKFAANFLLPIGTDWNAFTTSPINATLEFPSIFLASGPQLFHPAIFSDGILSGSLSLARTLQHPQITGDLQLVNGQLHNSPLNIVAANGRITFSGDRGSIDFLNAATSDVDVSARGEIDLHDINQLGITIHLVTPLFDVTASSPDCVSKIQITPAPSLLAPAVHEIELRGAPFRSQWTVTFREQTNAPTVASNIARIFPLCSAAGVSEKTFSLGALPRPQPGSEGVRPKKRSKHR